MLDKVLKCNAIVGVGESYFQPAGYIYSNTVSAFYRCKESGAVASTSDFAATSDKSTVDEDSS